MSHEVERLRILEMIETGQISAEEGIRRLGALPDTPAAAWPGGPEPAAKAQPAPPADLARWRNWWQIPFWLGVAVTVLGGGLLYWALAAAQFRLTGWFGLALCPFSAGVLVMALGAASRSAKWIHIRVDTGSGERPRRIALSFPLPIRPTAWFLRTFGDRIPNLRKTGVDELILALGETTTPQNPLYVEVEEGRNGEHVQVYIG